jgi:hypothetical protein
MPPAPTARFDNTVNSSGITNYSVVCSYMKQGIPRYCELLDMTFMFMQKTRLD